MRCEYDYTLRNLSDEALNYPVKFYTSKVSGFDEPTDPDIGLKSLIIDDIAVPPNKFVDIDKAADDDVGQHKYEKVVLVTPGKDIRVRVTFFQHKRTTDNDLWQSNNVCEGFELKLRYDPAVFQVFVEPVHPCDQFDSEIGPTAGENCMTVRIDRPLLPKNGVFMWWNTI